MVSPYIQTRMSSNSEIHYPCVMSAEIKDMHQLQLWHSFPDTQLTWLVLIRSIVFYSRCYSKCICRIALIVRIIKHFHLPQRKPISLLIHLFYPYDLIAYWHHDCIFCLWSHLLKTFHISRNVEFTVRRVWLVLLSIVFSSFVHAVEQDST